MNLSILGLLLATTITGPGSDPVVSPAAELPLAAANPAATGESMTLPAKTIVEIEISDSVSSKTAKPGDVFSIRLVEPVRLNGKLVLPIGTIGRGEVTHVAKAGWGGKPGEMIVMARYLECGNERIPLGHFHFGASGEAHFGAAVGASMIVPLAGLFISGGEMIVQAGTRGNAQISKDIAFSATMTQRCAQTQNP